MQAQRRSEQQGSAFVHKRVCSLFRDKSSKPVLQKGDHELVVRDGSDPKNLLDLTIYLFHLVLITLYSHLRFGIIRVYFRKYLPLSTSASSVFLHSSHLQEEVHLSPLLQHSQYFFRQLDFLQLHVRSATSPSKFGRSLNSLSLLFSHPIHLQFQLQRLPKYQYFYLG